eukprot:SAG11_NODE_838_length_6918_cov_3.566945_9_plen_28_part_01
MGTQVPYIANFKNSSLYRYSNVQVWVNL